MSLTDAVSPEKSAIGKSLQSEGRGQLISRLAHIITEAARFTGDTHGLDNGERAALARLDPDGQWRPHQIAALSRTFLYAGLEPATWHAETWQRWALIAHGMALAGHDASQSLGQQFSRADISESRVTKLLTSRDDAFRQLLPRLLRLLVSKNVAPNWHELGGLILSQGRQEEKAENIRLRIAGHFFSAENKKTKTLV
ncbi:type I-E CRISPR-associated protein Cse2/CasB [Nitrosomonas communis]|uniref:type I-E CRISPR-associated protein Cse2/CasB n=1 Tax=Nitrosomonas communis TaxID=44574 RepID=UPI0026EC65D7|nr:type I-E CRISPR-associated protein Cse2/CasB [Nitrosomonas communis]MCO6428462.1 type I-E CRISPR-associated protein Cse2/CasB [Nitrosomonas communis]